MAQVQPFWNSFEAKLIAVVDELAPLADFTNNLVKRTNTPVPILNKEYLRKRLLKQSLPVGLTAGIILEEVAKNTSPSLSKMHHVVQ